MENYTTKKVIGKGAFGKAVLALDKRNNEHVVIKVVDITDMPQSERRAAHKEVAILSKLCHPAIIGHKESFEADGSLHIVTELAECGDLSAYIARKRGKLIPEKRILSWLVQICLALLYVHKKKVLHRDMKTQNIFLTKNNGIKVGDFGIARVLKHTFECANTVVGTPYYLSPEICENKPYNHKSDIWAVGCIVYELCAQKHAFEGGSITSLIRAIMRGAFKPIPECYSRELRSLLNLMLSKNPSHRPSVGAILQLPFLQSTLEDYVVHCHSKGIKIPHVSLVEDEESKDVPAKKDIPASRGESKPKSASKPNNLPTPYSQRNNPSTPISSNEKQEEKVKTPEGAVNARDYLSPSESPKRNVRDRDDRLLDTKAAVLGDPNDDDRGLPDAEAIARLGSKLEGTVRIASEEHGEPEPDEYLPQPNIQTVLANDNQVAYQWEDDMNKEEEKPELGKNYEDAGPKPKGRECKELKEIPPVVPAVVERENVAAKRHRKHVGARRRRQKVPNGNHHRARIPESQAHAENIDWYSDKIPGKKSRDCSQDRENDREHRTENSDRSIPRTRIRGPEEVPSDRSPKSTEFADILPQVFPSNDSSGEKKQLEIETNLLREELRSLTSVNIFHRIWSAIHFRRAKIAREGGKFDLRNFTNRILSDEYSYLAPKFVHLIRLEDTLNELEDDSDSDA